MALLNSVVEPGDPAITTQSPLEQEMARLIAETLQLDVDPAAIAPCEPLFWDGLGLDSIDALELALAISKRYGVELKSDDARRGEIFASLRSLSACVSGLRVR
jgi:acyl carrier protein